MVYYERGLGDLGFRRTKEKRLGRRLGQGGAPTRRLGFSPRRRQQQVVAALAVWS